MAMRVVRAALLLGAVLPASVFAASFDCSKASSAVEQRLCGNDTLGSLGSLDERVDEAWKSLIAEAPRDRITEQRAWLKQRNACMQQGDVDACLAQQMQTRAKQLDAELPAERKALDAIIARIPTDPKAAAQALAGYNGPLASAWLVYLQHFVPEAGVDAATAKARAQSARKVLAASDDFASQLLEDAFNDPKAKPGAAQLRLLRMWIERLYGDDDRPYVHCFLFARHGELAYDAFGPLYGSTRDGQAPVCTPQGNLFDLPHWKHLEAAIAPTLEAYGMDYGTIRFSIFAGWRVLELRATTSPLLLLQEGHSRSDIEALAGTIRAWEMPDLADEERQTTGTDSFPRQQRDAAVALLQPVHAETRDWLIREHGLSADVADHVAQVILADWLEARLLDS